MNQRRIVGPQDKYERLGAQRFRDIRPWSTQIGSSLMGGASGLVLAAATAAMYLEPALVHLAVPFSLVFASLVLSQRTALPMRLPKSAGRKDYNDPIAGSRKPRMAAGDHCIGTDLQNRQLWVSSEDVRRHVVVPGTTGAGKTAAILSFLANPMCHSSGFVLVDGKADNKLYGEVRALARRFGREDDVLCLNFMTSSGSLKSNTYNPFSIGNADAVGELLISQLGEAAGNDQNSVFRGRAVALIRAFAPALVWLRDHQGMMLNIEVIRSALELRVIWKMAKEKKFEPPSEESAKAKPVSLEGAPHSVISPLLSYLKELPGYDMDKAWYEQRSDQPLNQHGFAAMYFTEACGLLTGSLGHIFITEHSDIDIRDVLLNRRILVVNLPSLEGSDDRLPALGRLVIGSLRAMMAQLLGDDIEGEFEDIVINKPGMGEVPFHIVFDELAYYATAGLARMLAQGRGLNISFWLGFQDIAGMWAALGERTNTITGNTGVKVIMKQQEAGRTREWIEQMAGRTFVSQAGGYQGDGGGQYFDTHQADLREVSKVDWNDTTSLIEGEAIFLWGGSRIYGKALYAVADPSGPMRMNKCLPLAHPNREKVINESQRVQEMIGNLKKGLAKAGSDLSKSPTLTAMIEAFVAASSNGQNVQACIDAMIQAGRDRTPVAAAPDDPANIYAVMFEAGELGTASPSEIQHPRNPDYVIEPAFFAEVAKSEVAVGVNPKQASESALALVLLRNAALEEANLTRVNDEELLQKLANEIDKLHRTTSEAATASVAQYDPPASSRKAQLPEMSH